MKKNSFVILLFLISAVFFSCQYLYEEEDDPKPTVSSIIIGQEDSILIVGSSLQLSISVTPEDITSYEVEWLSSDTIVATVSDGLVVAKSVGNATISATIMGKKAECIINVIDSSAAISQISTDATIFKGSGGSIVIHISSPDDWTISCDEDWLSASPSSGGFGKSDIVLTSLYNETGKCRSANISISSRGKTQSFSILQRPDIFSRSLSSSGKVTNGIKLSYSNIPFSSIYIVLPMPSSNAYQEITDLSTSGATRGACPDSINNYIWKNVDSDGIPKSGNYLISETFNTKVYNVTVDFQKIVDIPDYDSGSEECQKYLGKDNNGLIDPTHNKIISTANTLWEQSGGDIIDYARNCFLWTSANMNYGNANTGIHPINSLMETMTGDCGNYSSVFISLLRAKGIPARHIVMVHGKLDEYHVRAEFYVPAYGWIPADPTWGGEHFGKFAGDYIVMTQGINNTIRDYRGGEYIVDLLQTYCYWFWGDGNDFILEHICVGLE